MEIIPLFDAHCDTLSAALEGGGELFDNELHNDFRRLSAFSPAAQIFAVWDGRYEEKVALMKSFLESKAEIAALCRSIDELYEANGQGKVGVFLSVEGMEQLDCSLLRLYSAHERDGVCMVNLCWNFDNIICGAALGSGAGLTEYGRRFVLGAQRMGVAVDLSHASERAFWDTMELIEKPVVASHSNSAKLCKAAGRNLTDRQFLALRDCGGGVGLNLCPDFLGEDAGIEDAVRHLEHFLALGGTKSVFLGCDLDGIPALPLGMSGVQDMEKLYEALLRRNYNETLLRDIFYENLCNIMEDML